MAQIETLNFYLLRNEDSGACEEIPAIADLSAFDDGLDSDVSGFKGCVGAADCGGVDNIECRLSRVANGTEVSNCNNPTSR